MKNVFAALVISCLAATPALAEKPAGVTRAQVETAYTHIKLVIQSDLSCTTVDQCMPIPLGARACGGPRDYAVASIANPQLDEIKSLAHDLVALEQRYNRENRVVSICMMEMPPEVACVAKQCVEKDR